MARELASHLRLKLCQRITRLHITGVARELASHLRLKLISGSQAYLSIVRGEGTGFSSEIETFSGRGRGRGIEQVARELASHLRLKLQDVARHEVAAIRGEGTGFSSEIEPPVPAFAIAL